MSHDRPKAQTAAVSPISSDFGGHPISSVTRIHAIASPIAPAHDQW